MQGILSQFCGVRGGGANKLKNIEPYPIELSRLETP